MIAFARPIELCGCDTPADGRLISVDVALARGLALAKHPVTSETVPLDAATGRILAAPAVSPIPLPPFDNSAMDGYALRTADLVGSGPWCLPLSGRIVAGGPPMNDLPQGTAARIMTGAPVPTAANAVIMQEHVTCEEGAIVVDAKPRSGLNIRRMGEDLAAGETILAGGVAIGPREAAALASIGAASVRVRTKLRVSLFSTGSELVEPGEPLGPGQIWNSNRFMLKASLARPFVELTDLGAVPDDPIALTRVLLDASNTADVIVTTGGVSVGDEDHMPRVLREAGGNIHAMRVAMKPGKPLTVGTIREAIYLGLPGNPVSAFITWFAIGAQVAGRRAGLTETSPRRTLVSAAFETTRRPGRCEFRPARIVGHDGVGRQTIELLSPSYSARVALLAAADGLAIIPARAERIARGDLITFLPLH